MIAALLFSLAAAIATIAIARGLRAAAGPFPARAALVVLLGAAAAGIATGRPSLGLGVVFLFPSLVRRWRVGRRKAHRRGLDASAIAYLHALRGLVSTGESLPAALFRLSAAVDAPFADSLGLSLARYEGGRSLRECLAGFRARAALRLTGTCLATIEMAYAQGLAVTPLLDRWLPILERDWARRERVRKLRGAALAQVAIAACVPLVLAAALHFLQPESLDGFAASPYFFPILVGALACEALGTLAILRVSRFARPEAEECIQFFDALGLYLAAGYDLSYAWPETISALDIRSELAGRDGEGMTATLSRLVGAHGMWFGVLGELYGSGAAMAEAVRAVSDTLRGEHDRELEAHLRNLPTKVNVLVLLFFLPPTLMLLFSPLMIEISAVFR